MNILRALCMFLFASVVVAAIPRFASADYAGFKTRLTETGGVIDLSAPQSLAVSPDDVKEWVERAATAVTHFYGRYPVKHVSIIVRPGGDAVNGGVEYEGARIEIHLGRDADRKALLDDWMITHEMFHLSQPDVDGDNKWMSEGMADYLEPVARVRIGQITAERFWQDLAEGLPQGLPQPGDRGLDHTHTWGRTYWGGSLFWLIADIRVRQQTGNQKSVRDATQAVLNKGGDGSQTWALGDLLDAYDRGTGTTVFKQLHDEMGEKPAKTDLDALWKSLGVIYDGQKVTFDDSAPLAGIRRGITALEKPPG
jgi:predicted metalloprotease with PDZ domain